MDHSPLNKLPAEIRNDIAQRALYHGRLLCLPKGRNHIILKPEDPTLLKLQHPLALSQTCKQLRKETHAFFFDNTFIIQSDLQGPFIEQAIADFLCGIPSSIRPRMTQVTVAVSTGRPSDYLGIGQAIDRLRSLSSLPVRLEVSWPRRFEAGTYSVVIDAGALSESLSKALEKKDELKMPPYIEHDMRSFLAEVSEAGDGKTGVGGWPVARARFPVQRAPQPGLMSFQAFRAAMAAAATVARPRNN